MTAYLPPLMGGLLIGAASSLMLWGLGRIAGISGLYSSVLSWQRENAWKYSFLGGLLAGGWLMHEWAAERFFSYSIAAAPGRVILAGLLVGFGTRLGSGCTSGHGVCGIPRLAKRSLLATLIFMLAGVAVVAIEGVLG